MTYYVDSRSGDDSNDGLSESSPFATFARAKEASHGGDVIVIVNMKNEALDIDKDGITVIDNQFQRLLNKPELNWKETNT